MFDVNFPLLNVKKLRNVNTTRGSGRVKENVKQIT